LAFVGRRGERVGRKGLAAILGVCERGELRGGAGIPHRRLRDDDRGRRRGARAGGVRRIIDRTRARIAVVDVGGHYGVVSFGGGSLLLQPGGRSASGASTGGVAGGPGGLLLKPGGGGSLVVGAGVPVGVGSIDSDGGGASM